MRQLKIFINSVQEEFSYEKIYTCELISYKQIPDFIQEDIFKTIFWRKESSRKVTRQVTGEVSEGIKRVIFVLNGEIKRIKIQQIFNIKHEEYFRLNYIIPILESGYVEMLYPDNPNHPQQRYRLTEKGKLLKKDLTNKIK